MIKVLVFDLDDTLFPEHDFVRSGFQAVANWLEKKYSITNFFVVAWKLFEQGKRGNIFNLALEEMEVFEPEIIAELLQVYREHFPKIALHNDAKSAISYFKSKKELGIITDGYLRVQQNKVKALGIETDFDWIIYTDFYGRDCWKPSPIPYLKAMELAEATGSECVYVGDNPNKDFVTAKQLDWLTIQICREGEYTNVITSSEYKADLKIESLIDLMEVI
ncbi:HAD-superfamily hydrolase, subfamily IA, variant 1 [Calothrix sp. NIES-4071]|nr:HAD-superfamily hydrolase, subfamily IA, variant 1 [Calothrix sp. NIES-4071]BAZ58971.1 HAD-superfamily hydrolase, subfamily IA, variant 1 [Calothrix sp. NIES-4105]